MSKCISREGIKSRPVAGERQEAVCCGGGQRPVRGGTPGPGSFSRGPWSRLDIRISQRSRGTRYLCAFGVKGAPKPAAGRGMNQAEVDGVLGTGPPAHGARRPQQGGHWARPEGRRSKRRGLWLLPQNHLQAHSSPCGPVGSFREGAVTVFCASTELYRGARAGVPRL